jgi:hypothetical protein
MWRVRLVGTRLRLAGTDNLVYRPGNAWNCDADVAQTLVSAASRLVSTLFGPAQLPGEKVST